MTHNTSQESVTFGEPSTDPAYERHGTEYAYRRGCRCEDCRSAASDARRLRRAGLGPGKTKPGPIKHGYYRYRHHGCRCDVCRAAHAASVRRWYARHRARGGAR